MIAQIFFRSALCVLFFASLSHAQNYKVAPNPQAPGFDYFTAPESPLATEAANSRAYRDLVTMAHTDKILGFVQAGRMQDAINDVVYTLDRYANHPKGLQLAGVVASLAKKPSLATYYFERALKLYPEYAITYAQYGSYLVGSGQTDAGIVHLKEAVEKDPKLQGAYALLAKAYTKIGKSDLARQAADQARTLGYTGELP